IARVKLTYGPWRALKRVFKEAEARGGTEVFGALAARFDTAYAAGGGYDVTRGTPRHPCRPARRHLRRPAVTPPLCYPDVAADVLARYGNDTNWLRTWVANHVFYHGTGKYNRNRFTLRSPPGNILQHRAFADLWRRTPRPLFALLERARSE